jgi:hypothetical protein
MMVPIITQRDILMGKFFPWKESLMKQKRNFHLVRSISLFLFLLLLQLEILPPFVALANGSSPTIKEHQRQSAGSSRGNGATTELEALADFSEEIFALAVVGKMDRIGKKLEALKKNVDSINRSPSYLKNIMLPRLRQTVIDLEQAWSAKDRLETMRYANKITLIAAAIEVPLKTGLPTEVSLLDYNGRELAIWSEEKKIEKLSSIVMRMHLTWQTLMPMLIEHNGIRELRRFSEIMERLEMAHTAEEYGHLSKLVSPEIDSMRALFAKPSNSRGRKSTPQP